MSLLRTLVDVYCLPWGLIALWPAWELLRQSAAWRALRAMPPVPAQDRSEDDPMRFANVDILQPIRSGDDSLGDALGASLRALGHRGARLHWLIDEDDAAAASIVRTTLAAQPSLATRVAVSLHPPCPPGINPKLFKLDRALTQCTGDIVLVLDDDARLPPATLDALLATLLHHQERDALKPVVATALPAYLPAARLRCAFARSLRQRQCRIDVSPAATA